MTVSRLPLDGIRVIDFSRVLAGPLCSALLGDLGADVIKIEPPAGDDYRAIGPFANGESGLFAAMNRNKRSVVIDLKTADGQALAQSLCAQADVVVENFRPGVADRLGIGYAALSARNRALIYASVSGFGQTGPESHRPAYDIILQAMCGLMDATGSPDGDPTIVGDSVSDVVSGIFASWGVLAALVARDRTGEGSHVDVSMFDATMNLTAALVARYATTGVAQPRVGNRHPTSAPFGAYRAADGHFVVAVLNNKLFSLLADTIGHPALVDDPRFASDASRCEHEAALRACIEQWAATRSVADVNASLSAAGIPVAPIRSVRQALESEQARVRRLLVETTAADGSTIRLPVQPLKFSAYPGTRPMRAPQLGEHTREVLAHMLGLDEAAIAALAKAGVVHAAADAVDASAAVTLRQTETRQEMNDA
ncbi:CaiB/BaiF CoA transferase family protein [Burkholderia contaminans]|uniref:Acyl-CoA transferases/carnitine dehydratase n=1 Tax=Burkholderia contaminans TaxID=488447 RepID=A0A6P2YDP4_9BURK|nr:CoA transferase [Burkholderia contaminans]VWD17639.1 acyl-CoA transferases/carnitine dehydratase [Burkholderia contaminans]